MTVLECLYTGVYIPYPRAVNGHAELNLSATTFTILILKVYACVMDFSVGPLALHGIPADRIEYCRLLPGGSELKLYSDWRTSNYACIAYVNILRYDMYDKIYTVIKIKSK